MARFLKRHWAKDLEIETYITKGGKVRATINGKKADKCALGMIADATSYAAICWHSATYEDVLNDVIRQCHSVNYIGKWLCAKNNVVIPHK